MNKLLTFCRTSVVHLLLLLGDRGEYSADRRIFEYERGNDSLKDAQDIMPCRTVLLSGWL